jgi:AcrR family transcriptional regulator
VNSSPRRQPRGLLDRSRIVAAAIDLADRDGIDRLTMRNLADVLGYKVMALYNHVGSKDELCGLMVDTIAGDIHLSTLDSPMETVRAIAISTRAVLVRHPWAAELWLRYIPGPARFAMMERLLVALDASDLPPDIAHHGFHAVTNHVIGYTLQEMGMTAGQATVTDDPEQLARDVMAGLDSEHFAHTVAHIQQHLDGETSSSFEFVLDLILDGLVTVGCRRQREAGRKEVGTSRPSTSRTRSSPSS